MSEQLPLFDNEILDAMKNVQAQENILSSKYGLNGLLAIRSDDYQELQRLIGVAVDMCHKYNVNYQTMYELAQY